MQPTSNSKAASAPHPGALVNEDTVSQCKALIAHLRSGKSITPLEALQLYGCLRCASRIFNIRKDYELPVVTTMTTLPNRKRVAVYSLPKEFHYHA